MANRKRISSSPEITIIRDDLLIPVIDTREQPDDSGRHIKATVLAVNIAPMVATAITDAMSTSVSAAEAAYNYSIATSGYMVSAANLLDSTYNYSIATSGYMVSAAYWADIAENAVASNYSIVSGSVLLDYTYDIVEANDLTDITLPTAVGLLGKRYNIIRTGAGNVTITPNGVETISGDSNIVLTSQWDSIVIYSNNINWIRGS